MSAAVEIEALAEVALETVGWNTEQAAALAEKELFAHPGLYRLRLDRPGARERIPTVEQLQNASPAERERLLDHRLPNGTKLRNARREDFEHATEFLRRQAAIQTVCARVLQAELRRRKAA
jgi:hypothetical protein